MVLNRLRADPYTRSELGRHGVEHLAQNLSPGRCQSCGNALGDEVPSVVLVEHGSVVTASLHHGACQQPRWTRSTMPPIHRYLTPAAVLMKIPFGDPGHDPFTITMLANPGLEQVTLAANSDGKYNALTVDSYLPLGLTRPHFPLPCSTVDDVVSWVSDDRVVVRCGEQHWVCGITSGMQSAVNQAIRDQGGIALAVTTALDPSGRWESREQIKRVLRTGDLAVVIAPLCVSEPMPDLDGHVASMDSDLAAADEARDADWLPVSPYRGPSYDPATGLFEMGTGMDGPHSWQLNTPGARVENGVITGPAGQGKTNSLRIVLVEALSTGVFDCAVADPLDRNGLAEVFHHFPTATSIPTTVRLLEQVTNALDDRMPLPDPSHDQPGLIVAIDDAHAVLRDPYAAELAERIAIDGPDRGVGLVVSMASSTLEDFGGRRRLALALAERNRFAFSLEHLEQLRALEEP